MSMWHIFYRGSLSNCNYTCKYCPFGKTVNTRTELDRDKQQLNRFVAWVADQERAIGILMTPWGEALTHDYYRRALRQLSSLPHVYRVAIQTNLSAPLGKIAEANHDSLALWTTFHPSQVSPERFAERCQELDVAGIHYSVGAVGLREHLHAIETLRRLLRPDVYLWVNAFKQIPDYYHTDEVNRLLAIDPYFHWNLESYRSYGLPCVAGETAFAVDGDGNMRRCHFVKEVIGNIYAPDFGTYLKTRTCPIATCGCHIGYIHRPDLKLQELYGSGLLERIPSGWPSIDSRFGRKSFCQANKKTSQITSST